ncbi:hypothetical protein PLESTB_000381200 [Pleodorina starrii]|uniref:Uncharacterized protein n=1 Tax=Pleodorina starrii TaxID=330485 RepID=A0A9W6BE13_9CHLO|nr:hypothetical protein PLESTM_000013900 [Pleodorina starrii]GLC50456.1 hypothetical protein PLESTB_000381200 [Pleodorina starrii]GLC73307.1 hypothetical protein PLESTF_001358800 [Pleodorina starrii]
MFVTSATAPSVFFVLSLGALSGGVVKGVTGFGNAIINLLVWVAFTAAGVDSGPLQLAVLADSFGCVVCSIPLLLMTAAHKTADWRLVTAILVFTSSGAPLGAVLLTHLPVRWVELSMACVLVLVICLQIKLHETLRKRLDSWRLPRVNADASAADTSAANVSATDTSAADVSAADTSAAADSSTAGASPPSPEKVSLLTPPTLAAGAVADSAPFRDCEPPAGPEESEGRSMLDPAATKEASSERLPATILIACCVSTDEVCRPDGERAPESEPRSHPCAHRDAGDVEAGESVRPGGAADDTAPLLEPGALASDAVSLPGAEARRRGSCTGGGPERGASRCGSKGPVSARLRRWVERQDWREMQRILLVGSVAGFASGVMGGMTGIGGPPLMFMYERLQVAKDVVRGTNAVNNVLQVRLVSYLIMGVFKREDVMIYGVTAAAGLMGVIIGNGLAGRLDQRGFSRVLVALMVVCCALLFASAAGLKGHAA